MLLLMKGLSTPGPVFKPFCFIGDLHES
jgi:hypothetical protein